MSPRYTPKVFLRQAPNRLLQSYFAAKGLLGDLPWNDLRETRIEPIHQAILALPEAQRREIGRDFRAIWDLAARRRVRASDTHRKAAWRGAGHSGF